MRENHTKPEGGEATPYQRVKAAKPLVGPDGKPKLNKVSVEHGLELWVSPRGLKTWRCKAQRNGKRTTITLGHFPAMQLDEARAARMTIRRAEDPRAERVARIDAAAEAATNTLRVIGARWVKVASIADDWSSRHKGLIESRLTNHVYPRLGNRPVAAIKGTDIEDLVIGVHAKHKSLAIVIKQYITRILDYAWSADMIAANPAHKVKKNLPKRLRADEAPRAHVRTIEQARAVLAAVEAPQDKGISPMSPLVHRLIALTGVRKLEAVNALWSEVDLERALWTIGKSRTKGKREYKREHVVALAPQAIELFQAAAMLRCSEYVFPSPIRPGKPLDDNALNEYLDHTLRRAGLGKVQTVHGWRSTFSTIMNERNPGDFRVIDAMLAHAAYRDSPEARLPARGASVERRYNHATHQSARHRIAADWADLLLEDAPPAFALIGEAAPAGSKVTSLDELRARRAA